MKWGEEVPPPTFREGKKPEVKKQRSNGAKKGRSRGEDEEGAGSNGAGGAGGHGVLCEWADGCFSRADGQPSGAECKRDDSSPGEACGPCKRDRTDGPRFAARDARDLSVCAATQWRISQSDGRRHSQGRAANDCVRGIGVPGSQTAGNDDNASEAGSRRGGIPEAIQESGGLQRFHDLGVPRFGTNAAAKSPAFAAD